MKRLIALTVVVLMAAAPAFASNKNGGNSHSGSQPPSGAKNFTPTGLASVVNPKLISPTVVSGINPKVVDPKLVSPKVIDPKLVNPKLTTVVDPKLVNPKLTTIVNPKLTTLVDPKLIDPKLTKIVDPKLTKIVDPKLTKIVNPKILVDPKVIDPKLTKIVDPKLTKVIDPKTGTVVDPKMTKVLNPKHHHIVFPVVGFWPPVYPGTVVVDGGVVVAPATVVETQGAVLPMQYERYLRVKNETDEAMRVFVLYHTRVNGSQFAWVPEAPGAGEKVYSVELAPGADLVLTDENDQPISANKARVWAAGASRSFLAHQDRDLWLVPEVDDAGIHRYPSETMQTFTFRLRAE